MTSTRRPTWERYPGAPGPVPWPTLNVMAKSTKGKGGRAGKSGGSGGRANRPPAKTAARKIDDSTAAKAEAKSVDRDTIGRRAGTKAETAASPNGSAPSSARGSASSRPRPAPTKRTTPPASARYTPPVPKSQKVSPIWVPILMFTCLGLGMLMIILNYVNVLPGPEPSNAYLMAGLGLITVGFITATKYH